ncbi:Uncharacterized protein TCM_045388 [Theobroma cacao]|uniref:Reverse transcriptase Ty1/copia-type domain-containing protein n=1 Tax=Theobroma cacao TaxID=3641 RepID=A0A061FYT7_THECC|nr:Uncharacterized protein TCM_045388 [Theobroma cacao]
MVENTGNYNLLQDGVPEEFDEETNIEDESLAVRGTRSLQEIYARCSVAIIELASFTEAVKDDRWVQAMNQEMEMIKKNGTWMLVNKPTDQHIIGVKWIYKTKLNADDESTLMNCKEKLKKEFKMSDLGKMNYFLGLQFIQDPDYICLHQSKYTLELLKKFHMENCKAVESPLATNCKLSKDDGAPDAAGTSYRSLIVSLLYLTTSRPDIMFSISLLSCLMQKPSQIHYTAAK